MTTPAVCRVSGSSDVRVFLDFGSVPLADVLIEEKALGGVDAEYPLRLAFCPESKLVQLVGDVPLDELYSGNYPYYTSVIPALVRHFREGAASILARKPLRPGALVVEAASNDGCQLAAFQEAGARVLGVDPAPGPAEVANKAGIETLCRFFDDRLATELEARGEVADVITGNNVLNLVQDLPDFVRAVDRLLAADGLVVLEVPYFVDTVQKNAFDNVFHQNVTYWTLSSLENLFASTDIVLVDVERISTFGGSLRVYFQRDGTPTTAVQAMLASERAMGVHELSFYEEFAERSREIQRHLREVILGLAAQGKRIVAYGAAGGMATTLISYLDLPEGTLAYAVDISHHKHGRYTAGSRLLVRPIETLVAEKPDYALLLAWNFEQAIRDSQAEWLAAGGKFIVPIPSVQVD